MNKIKLIICATFGNCFEVYDFIIYQILAVHISKHFFDSESGYAFLLTQLVYATGLISRPLGGLIFGYIADRAGRKLSLEKTILISGLCTAAIGFIPSYESIGILSTLALILSRFLQGVALGGEQGSSLVFLIEHSSPKNRGFLSSFCCSGQNLGLLLAITINSIFNSYAGHDDLSNTGWRWIFILSFFVGFFGYWIRKKTNETIDFLIEDSSEKSIIVFIKTTREFVSKNKIFLLSSFFLVFFGTFIGFTIFVLASGHLKKYADAQPIYNYIQYLMPAILIVSIPLFGYLSDKIGRKMIVSHSLILISSLSFPFFQSFQTMQSQGILLISILLSISCAAYFSVTPTFIAELLPTQTRCLNFAIFYIIPASFIAGISPMVSSYLLTLNPSYISLIIAILAFCSIISFSTLQDPLERYKTLHKHSFEFLKP